MKLMVAEIVECVRKFLSLGNVGLTVCSVLLLSVHWSLKFLIVLSSG